MKWIMAKITTPEGILVYHSTSMREIYQWAQDRVADKEADFESLETERCEAEGNKQWLEWLNKYFDHC